MARDCRECMNAKIRFMGEGGAFIGELGVGDPLEAPLRIKGRNVGPVKCSRGVEFNVRPRINGPGGVKTLETFMSVPRPIALYCSYYTPDD